MLSEVNSAIQKANNIQEMFSQLMNVEDNDLTISTLNILRSSFGLYQLEDFDNEDEFELKEENGI